MEHLLRYSPEVAQARAEGRPVVALESTVISHGLPYPENVETALAMEDAIRQQGAAPATMAVLAGQIHIGLSQSQIEHLAQAQNVRKCSRRDFPIALGLKQDAATTVAGTMILAHKVGIRVFATGGIGGVHRGAPFDQSADLLELGRTPVAVVCSGAKSILDLPLTLEVLETQGVPVLGYQTDDLPAFYTRHSGLPIDARIDTPEQAAQVIQAAQAIGAQHGLLIAVPVPEHLAIEEQLAERAIVQATEEAQQQGISGKAVTPFVLSRVAALTEGQTKTANKALLANNAATAAQIALALAALG